MSLHITSYLVFGVKVERRELLSTVTKFNEDTGAPYEKKVSRTATMVVGEDIELSEEAFDKGDVGDFALLCSDYSHNKNWVFGRIFGTTSQMTTIKNLDLDFEVNDRKTLTDLGITQEPRLHLLVHYSY